MDQVYLAANIVTGFSVSRPYSVPETEIIGQRLFEFQVFLQIRFEQDFVCGFILFANFEEMIV